MKLKKGIPPGFEKRHILLKWLLDNHIALSTTEKILLPMEGKTDPEKEQIAEEILNKLQNAKENGTFEKLIEEIEKQ